MDPCLLVSPHFDDVAISCGQFLAGWPGCTVATVCSSPPAQHRMRASFDESCGFANAAEAVRRRAQEDRNALHLLRARPLPLGLVDSQYGQPVDPCEVARRVGAAVDRLGARLLLGPVGVRHPDHVAVSDAVCHVAEQSPGVEVWLYEELPGRVLWPEDVCDRLAWLKAAGWRPELGFVGTGPVEVKEQAVARYRSQLWAIDPDCRRCPERFWHLER